MFTKNLIQAISNWQRGGDAKLKQARGAALKTEAEKLPKEFRQPAKCFRKIALDGHSLMYMGTYYQLSETVSSWTKSQDVAKAFKRGVPPAPWQGVIFSITPAAESVILDLSSLFANAEFCAAVQQHKSSIEAFEHGIGRYGDSQQEVVLELGKLPLDSLVAWGGYTSPELRLAEMYFGDKPTEVQMAEFRDLMKKAGHQIGAYWMFTPEAVARISEKLKHHAARLSS
jgi:hypothetical protein